MPIARLVPAHDFRTVDRTRPDSSLRVDFEDLEIALVSPPPDEALSSSVLRGRQARHVGMVTALRLA